MGRATRRSSSAEPRASYEAKEIKKAEDTMEKTKREARRSEIAGGVQPPTGPPREQERAVDGKDLWQAKLS